jgi:hypothetical protein
VATLTISEVTEPRLSVPEAGQAPPPPPDPSSPDFISKRLPRLRFGSSSRSCTSTGGSTRRTGSLLRYKRGEAASRRGARCCTPKRNQPPRRPGRPGVRPTSSSRRNARQAVARAVLRRCADRMEETPVEELSYTRRRGDGGRPAERTPASRRMGARRERSLHRPAWLEQERPEVQERAH